MRTTEPKRHTCIVCKTKRTEAKMVKFRQHWACAGCLIAAPDPGLTLEDKNDVTGGKVRVLNLYAGIGGNRYKWPDNITVTAIEKDAKVAAEYKKLFPEDTVIVTDAHQYLLKNYWKYDIIWSSPPCQSHSRMNYIFEHARRTYIDLSLYQQIILLRNFFKGAWVVENVKPYYETMIIPDKVIGRHCFWSSFKIKDCHVPELSGFIELGNIADKEVIMDWLGFRVDRNLYLTGKNCVQVFRNCVHPAIGLSIFEDAIRGMQIRPHPELFDHI